jgi:hypothetical protein
MTRDTTTAQTLCILAAVAMYTFGHPISAGVCIVVWILTALS